MATQPRDKYTKAIRYLRAQYNKSPEDFRNAVQDAWNSPNFRLGSGGELFTFVTPDGHYSSSPTGIECGCLTQVKNYESEAYTRALTTAIRADKSLPSRIQQVHVEHLPIFAKWQRRIDCELRNKMVTK